jgi:hypothetical protein
VDWQVNQMAESSKDRTLQERLEAFTGHLAEQIKREFAEELARDPKAIQTAVLRLLRRALPLKRGRPTNPLIDDALRMHEQGKPVEEILRFKVRGFDKLDTWGRMLAKKGLHTAISRRRKHSLNRPPSN